MSAPVLSKKKIVAAAADAAADLGLGEHAEAIAERVAEAPAIAAATTPIPRVFSETLQGLTGIALAQMLDALGVTKTIVLTAGLFGQNWEAENVSSVATLVVTIGCVGWAWFGRETTTRRLSGWFRSRG